MRGAIIKAAMFAAYCFVIVVTIGFAIAGYRYGFFAAVLLGIRTTDNNVAVLGFVVGALGGIVGFIVSSFAAAALFLLREIAENTALVAASPLSTERWPPRPKGI